ncbi:MAG: hypothetical protein ACKVQK_10945 [Burkholderiales bacterium]
MKTKTLGAMAAFAIFGTAQVALADTDHRHHGRQGQGTTTPQGDTPQAPRAHGHSPEMASRMAEKHARMNERHGAPGAATQAPRGSQAPHAGGHAHEPGHRQGHSH